MKPMTRAQFALRLLNWHSGGGSPTYALGSSLYAGITPSIDTIRKARDEFAADAERMIRSGYLSRWDKAACQIWADALSEWLTTGTPPWEDQQD